MELKRRKKLTPTIPLSSMADIAFLLLIFFIVTSTMKIQDIAQIKIPSVEKIEVVEHDDRLNIWLDKEGILKIQRKEYSLLDAEIYLKQLMVLQPKTIIFFNGDKRCSFRKVEKILKTLTDSGAIKVVFATKQAIKND